MSEQEVGQERRDKKTEKAESNLRLDEETRTSS